MFLKKKKKKGPSPKEVLCQWDKRFESEKYCDLITYNYKATKNGFEKIKGIAVITKQEILCYEDGQKTATLPLAGATGFSLMADGGSARILLHRGEPRFTVATGDLKYKERYGTFVQALDRMLKEGDYRQPGALREKTCPHCGIQHDFDYPACPLCGHKYYTD